MPKDVAILSASQLTCDKNNKITFQKSPIFSMQGNGKFLPHLLFL